jgi:hypothetical protein
MPDIISTHRMRLKVRMARENRRRYGLLTCELGMHVIPFAGAVPDLHEIIPRGYTPSIRWQEEHLERFYNEINCALLCQSCHAEAQNDEARKILLWRKVEQGQDVVKWLDELPLSDATLGALRRWAHETLMHSEVQHDNSDSPS